MQRAVATQAALEPVKFLLNEAAENLAAHANMAVSKAHSINLAVGYVDDDGNDRTQYRDDHGNVVGTLQLQFTIGGVIYYAPANSTSLSGNPGTDGIVEFPDTASVASNRETAWVTDFTAQEIDFIQQVDAVLNEHTQKGHWEVHGSMTVSPVLTYDSKSNLVGRYQIRFTHEGKVYAIPCDTRIGGPSEAVSGNDFLPTAFFTGGSNGAYRFQGTTLRIDEDDGGSFPSTVTLSFANISGSAPIAYKWQWSVTGTEGTWNDVESGTVFPVTVGLKGTTGVTGDVDSGTTTTVFTLMGFGGTNSVLWYMRAVFTNDSGEFPSQTFLVHMHSEEDDGWWPF